MNMQSFHPLSIARKLFALLLIAGLPLTITACGADTQGGLDLPPLPEQEQEGQNEEGDGSENEANADAEPLYMVGDATPGGWSLDNKEALNSEEDSNTVYLWQGELSTGEIKFANYEATDFCGGPWLLATTEGESPNLDGSGNAYNRIEDCPDETGAADNKWVIEQEGGYQVTVDMEAERVYFDLLEPGSEEEAASDYYAELYLVGDAAPGGWELDNAAELTVDAENSAVFTWEGTLAPGEFKIATQNVEFGGGHDWIHPLEAGQSLTATDYVIVAAEEGATDDKWTIDEERLYRIRVDLEHETIHFGAPYANLFLVGDATSGGWSLDDATMMERDSESLYRYTATVELAAGSFKIATGTVTSELTFEAGRDWIHPNTDGQPLVETAFSIVTAGEGEDYQWQIGEGDAGTYEIILDLEADTIVIDRQ